MVNVKFSHLSFETSLSFEIHETGQFSLKVTFYRTYCIKQLEMSLKSLIKKIHYIIKCIDVK